MGSKEKDGQNVFKDIGIVCLSPPCKCTFTFDFFLFIRCNYRLVHFNLLTVYCNKDFNDIC